MGVADRLNTVNVLLFFNKFAAIRLPMIPSPIKASCILPLVGNITVVTILLNEH